MSNFVDESKNGAKYNQRVVGKKKKKRTKDGAGNSVSFQCHMEGKCHRKELKKKSDLEKLLKGKRGKE